VEYRLDEHESFEVGETLIADAIQQAGGPIDQIGVGVDMIATPAQIAAGEARRLSDYLLKYMAETYPRLFARFVGITDDETRRPIADIMATQRLAESAIDDVHLFVDGEYVQPPAAPRGPDWTSRVTEVDPNVVIWGDPTGPHIQIWGLALADSDGGRSLDELHNDPARTPTKFLALNDPIALVTESFMWEARWQTYDEWLARVAPVMAPNDWRSLTRSPGQIHVMGNDRQPVHLSQAVSLQFHFIYPARLSIVQALQTIEAIEYARGHPLPAAILGGFYAVAWCFQHEHQRSNTRDMSTFAAVVLSSVCERHSPKGRPDTGHLPDPCPRAAVTTLSQKMLNGLPLTGEATEGGLRATDIVRICVAASEQVLTPASLQQAIRQWVAPQVLPEILRTAHELVVVHALLAGGLKINVAGVEVQGRGMGQIRHALLQLMELTAGNISGEAVRALLPDRQLPELLAWPSDRPDQAPVPEIFKGLASALVRDATEQAVYAPQGAFLLRVPNELSVLRQRGVTELRVYADPNGLWLRLRGDRDALVGWRPEAGLRSFVLPTDLTAWLNVVASALWHDLRVGGSAAVPRTDGRPELIVGGAPLTRGAKKRPKPAGVQLPSVRHIYLSGVRQWSTPDSRARIIRQMHGVRGYVRRLPVGWSRSPEAVRFSREYGVVLPDDYTFVRPHTRGAAVDDQPAADAPVPTVIHARGLLSLLAFQDMPA
jgi:hypothetical protein